MRTFSVNIYLWKILSRLIWNYDDRINGTTKSFDSLWQYTRLTLAKRFYRSCQHTRVFTLSLLFPLLVRLGSLIEHFLTKCCFLPSFGKISFIRGLFKCHRVWGNSWHVQMFIYKNYLVPNLLEGSGDDNFFIISACCVPFSQFECKFKCIALSVISDVPVVFVHMI